MPKPARRSPQCAAIGARLIRPTSARIAAAWSLPRTMGRSACGGLSRPGPGAAVGRTNAQFRRDGIQSRRQVSSPRAPTICRIPATGLGHGQRQAAAQTPAPREGILARFPDRDEIREVLGVVFSPDGRRLLSIADEERITVRQGRFRLPVGASLPVESRNRPRSVPMPRASG